MDDGDSQGEGGLTWDLVRRDHSPYTNNGVSRAPKERTMEFEFACFLEGNYLLLLDLKMP